MLGASVFLLPFFPQSWRRRRGAGCWQLHVSLFTVALTEMFLQVTLLTEPHWVKTGSFQEKKKIADYSWAN